MSGFFESLFAHPVSCTRERVGDPDSAWGWADAKVCTDSNGEVTGGGFSHGESLHDQKNDISVDYETGVESNTGSWIDEAGNILHGLQTKAEIFKHEARAKVTDPSGLDHTVGVDVGGPDFNVGATYDETNGTAQMGATANVASVSATAGTEGSSTDSNTKFGVSEGVGANVRAHYGDTDHDNHKDYGVGFDAGPVGVDYQTEDPLRSYLNVVTLGGMDNPDPHRTNMTEEVWGQDTQGTRGGATPFGEMGAMEKTAHALLNPGMNPEVRKQVIDERIQGIKNLFGGVF